MKLKILYLFLLLCATLQLQAQCTNYMSAEAISFDGEDICFGDIIVFDIIINTNGDPIGEGYDIEVSGTNGAVGFGFADDSGFGFADLIIDPIEGCDPVEVVADFAVFCGTTGELIDNFSAGPFTVYPELIVDVVPPGCNEGENGSATLITFNGDICQGPIEGIAGTSGGDCDTQQPGTLSYNFVAYEGTPCEQIFAQDIETPCAGLSDGCTDPTACNFDPNAACDDGSCIFLDPCCPRPLPDQFPTAICPFTAEEYCVTFDGDINEIDVGSMFLDSEFGSLGFPVSSNPAENQICFIIDGFPAEPCTPSPDNFTLFYFCPNLGQDVAISDIIITIYPEPFEYEVTSQPSTDCGGVPTLFAPPCGELFIGNIVDPINDCDNPVSGVVPYDIDPGFPIAPDAPDCFTAVLGGEVPIAPCLEECPCDGAFCNGICIDLTAVSTNFPAFACPDDGFDFQIDIEGEGADIADYFILINDNNGNNIFFETHNSGDPTTYNLFEFPFVNSCTPEDRTYTYEIQCEADGTILATGTVGTVTVYPSPFNFFPNITPSIACSQDLVIESTCGTVILNPDPIPTPECGGMDTEVNWSIDFGFEYPTECPPFPIEGTETVFACTGTPGDPCEAPCVSNAVLDENCNCVGEVPSATLDSTLPTDICELELITLTATIDSEPGPDGVLVVINDQFNQFPGSAFVNPGDPLTVDIELFLFNNNSPCGTSSYDLTLELFCPTTFTPISAPIDLGTVTVYPPADVNNAVGGACTDAPTDNCNNATILYSTDGFATPGSPTPPALNPGDADVTVSWIATTGGEGCEATGEYVLTCPGEASTTIDISDPCSCEVGIGTCPATATPPGNIDVDGDGVITNVDYVADVITITVSPPVSGQAWEIVNPDGALDCTGASIGPAGLTDQGGGVFTITVYYPADGSGFGTMTFASDTGETVSITNPSADYVACDCTPPEPPTCDLTVLTDNFACNDNGTPDVFTDDTVDGFNITVNDTGGAAGTMWTADDGMGNTITGAYGAPTTLTPSTMYPAGTVLTLVITDTSNPACSTTFDVTIGDCAAIESIPTLGEWALIMLALLMSIIAVLGIRQQTTMTVYQEIEK